MRLSRHAILPIALATLAACGSDANRQAQTTDEPRLQIAKGEYSAAAPSSDSSGDLLGLTDSVLLDADLVTRGGLELGDVEEIRRDASGAITGLLIEIEDSEPDRYVVIPIDGLTVKIKEVDLQTDMTRQDLYALPEARR